MIRNLLLASLAAGLFVLVGQTASAQYGGFPFGGYGYNTGYGLPYWTTSVPTPPYYALHPPVYYSMPVPRTYGYSPFAYPGCVMTPEVVMPHPETIINPHVQPLPLPKDGPAKDGEPKEKKTSTKVAVKPQVMVNPYFVRRELVSGK